MTRSVQTPDEVAQTITTLLRPYMPEKDLTELGDMIRKSMEDWGNYNYQQMFLAS